MKLNRSIQKALPIQITPDNRNFRYIEHDYQGNCPILEDGLCLLYKEKGEEAVPEICRLFPRSFRNINGRNLLLCSNSCERVVELLYEKREIQMIEMELDDEAKIFHSIETEDVEWSKQILEILTDKSRSLVQRLQQIGRRIHPEEFDQDFQSMEDPLDNILELLDHLNDSDASLSLMIAEVSERYRDKKAAYRKDSIQFENSFPFWMDFFEVLLHNFLLYENFFLNDDIDRKESYRCLTTVYGLLRIMCIGYTSIHTDEESLIDIAAALFRLFDHSAFCLKISRLKDNAAIRLKL